jgi:beta-glucosidase
MSGESSSRTDLNIPDVQQNLLKELFKDRQTVVLVLFTDVVYRLAELEQSMFLHSELYGFGGSEAAYAIGDASSVTSIRWKTDHDIPEECRPGYHFIMRTKIPDPIERWQMVREIPQQLSRCRYEPLYPSVYGLSYTTSLTVTST